MEDLVELLPRWLVAVVLGPFLLGVALLALLVRPTGTGMAFIFLVFTGGMFVIILLALGLTLAIRQSRGLEAPPGEE